MKEMTSSESFSTVCGPPRRPFSSIEMIRRMRRRVPPERTLLEHYRLLAASFSDAAPGARWRERLGGSFREALDLLVFALAIDLGQSSSGPRSDPGVVRSRVIRARLCPVTSFIVKNRLPSSS
jgi:hypothetical protein